MNPSKIILGTAQFGLEYGINNESGQPSDSTVIDLLDFAIKNEVNTLDTADAYGAASEIIGKFHDLNDERFLVNTKFIHSELTLSEQLEKSLNTLSIDHVNVYYFHHYKDFLIYPSLKDQLKRLKEDGKICKIGLSVYDNKELLSAIESDLIDVIQFPFNLLDNYSIRGDLMILAKKRGKELHARSVFLQGLFFMSLESIPSKLNPLKPYLQKINKLSKENHISIYQIALLYVLQQSGIDQVLIGVDNLEQLNHNLNIGNIQFPESIINTVNQMVVKETELLYPKNWT